MKNTILSYPAIENYYTWNNNTSTGIKRCNVCGGLIYQNDPLQYSADFYCNCQEIPMGWICPVCGVANSPDTKQCPCSGKYIVPETTI